MASDGNWNRLYRMLGFFRWIFLLHPTCNVVDSQESSMKEQWQKWQKEFSSACGEIAFMRDRGECQYCRYVKLIPFVRAAETDHVFGRSMAESAYLDHWLLRLTLCTPCHYEKHHGKNDWWDQDGEIMALCQANIDASKIVLHPSNAIQMNVFLRRDLLGHGHIPTAMTLLNDINAIALQAWDKLYKNAPRSHLHLIDADRLYKLIGHPSENTERIRYMPYGQKRI